ncbi:MAG: hypothetical protein H6727_12160 [Myxococcales bacterium]|nr:hypothetical protein [Myxococcales bacterium]
MTQLSKTKQGLARLFLFTLLFFSTQAISCIAKRDATNLPCQQNADCWGGDLYCHALSDGSGEKICLANRSCTQASECSEGQFCCVPSGQTQGAFCRYNEECAQEQCSPKCESGYTCVPGGKCLYNASEACGACYYPQKCNDQATTPQCQTPCTSNADCNGQICTAGYCVPCTETAQCAVGETCNNGTCSGPQGQTCTPGGGMAQCPTGICCPQKQGSMPPQGDCITVKQCAERALPCSQTRACPPELNCGQQGTCVLKN